MLILFLCKQDTMRKDIKYIQSYLKTRITIKIVQKMHVISVTKCLLCFSAAVLTVSFLELNTQMTYSALNSDVR